MKADPIVEARDLRVTFHPRGRPPVTALRGLHLGVGSAEVHALVGESGAGKSVSTLAFLGLLPATAVVEGRVLWQGLPQTQPDLAARRGREVGTIFQEPATYLNPGLRIGVQIGEMLTHHLGWTRSQAAPQVTALLDDVGLSPRVAEAYAHELSGGMQQRAMIAMAIACGPTLLLADEPTTALDATTQLQVLALLDHVRTTHGMAILLVSHDLAVVNEVADRISVLYAGRVVESGPAAEVLQRPGHPYTRMLLESVPDPARRGSPLRVLPGRAPEASDLPRGCAFHPRCPFARDECRQQVPITREISGSHSAACVLVGDSTW